MPLLKLLQCWLVDSVDQYYTFHTICTQNISSACGKISGWKSRVVCVMRINMNWVGYVACSFEVGQSSKDWPIIVFVGGKWDMERHNMGKWGCLSTKPKNTKTKEMRNGKYCRVSKVYVNGLRIGALCPMDQRQMRVECVAISELLGIRNEVIG
jgi:hypothetical protein